MVVCRRDRECASNAPPSFTRPAAAGCEARPPKGLRRATTETPLGTGQGARDAFLQAEARDPSYVDTQLNLGAVLFGSPQSLSFTLTLSLSRLRWAASEPRE